VEGICVIDTNSPMTYIVSCINFSQQIDPSVKLKVTFNLQWDLCTMWPKIYAVY